MIADKRKTGVYRIRNLINNRVYVGSASHTFASRWKTHRKQLREGRHHSTYLQNSWSKYGEDAFVFEIVERTAPEHAVAVEQTFIDFWKSSDPKYGYNICPTAGSIRGLKRDQAFRDAISARNNQRYLDPAEHDKSSAGQRERWSDEEARAAQSEALTKHWSDPAVREEMSRKTIKRWSNDAARAQASESALKRHQDPDKRKAFIELMTSDEHREKLSLAHSNPSPETRAIWSEQRKSMWADPDFRARMSAARKGYKQTPEHIAKRVATLARNRAAKAAALAAQQETP